MSKQRKVKIAGSGISGLTLAIALAQRNWDVQILERSAELREIGAGLYTWENGLKVLESIGVFEDACKTAEFMSSIDMVDERQELIHSIPFTSERRFCVLPRRDIYNALVQAAQKAGVDIVTNAHVVSADPAGKLTLEDGTSLEADLVIGADGVHSKIRDSLDLAKSIVKLDDGALRTLIPRRAEDKSGVTTENWSGYRRIGVGPSSGEYLYVFLTGLAEDTKALSDPINKDEWLRSFPHLESVIERIEYTRLDRHFINVTCKSWSAGKVALIGDAAHGMAPNLGQGAGLGMTSALELAVQLEEHDEIEVALQKWESNLRPTVETTQRWARIYSKAATQWPEDLMDVRYEIIKKAMTAEKVEDFMSMAARYTVESKVRN